MKTIAYYLPQFHPIPENDEWWGKGFTEWTNVAKAKPLFKGHYQPHIPADLGFYDLRLAETREAQARLASEYGIYGFCYWHYWFGNGKTLLERPLQDMLKLKKPDFPFCLGWANESWSGVWHGNPQRILIEQLYPGESDYKSHFHYVKSAFKDSRYIKVDDKPIFVLYRYKEIPQLQYFVDCWNELSIQAGLKGIYFVGISSGDDLTHYGLNGTIVQENILFEKIKWSFLDKLSYKLIGKTLRELLNITRLKLNIYSYKEYANVSNNFILSEHQYPVVLPNWDNTPRSGGRGYVLHDSNPDLFEIVLQKAINQIGVKDEEHKIIFIKSWNEWAEGNHLEPDLKFGKGYLEIIKKALLNKHYD